MSDKAVTKSENSKQTKVYKEAEFNAFIKSIKAGQVAHWAEIAEALGIDKTTIVEWKKLPEAQEAIKQGIDHAIAQMERSGTRDWRMWAEKLKMLGINPANRIEGKIAVVNVTEEILKQFGVIDDTKTEKTTDSTSS